MRAFAGMKLLPVRLVRFDQDPNNCLVYLQKSLENLACNPAGSRLELPRRRLPAGALNSGVMTMRALHITAALAAAAFASVPALAAPDLTVEGRMDAFTETVQFG